MKTCGMITCALIYHPTRAYFKFTINLRRHFARSPFVEQVMSAFTNFKWTTASDFTSEPYRVRASSALEQIDWNALAEVAEESRKIPCKVGEQYGLGGRHIVREILFDDGVHWIGRVSIPRVNFNAEENFVPQPVRQSWTADKAAEMQSEIDTMSFVREHTDISIPRVFAYDTTATNPVGAPFMLMECVKGTCGMDMANSLHNIPTHFRGKYYAAEAAILVSALQDWVNCSSSFGT
jgi:hypothetical protein